jgi:hypothetical protein
MLAGSSNIPKASLQGIRIEQRSPSRRLKRDHRHTLRDLGDVATGGADFRLTRGRRNTSSLRFRIQVTHYLEPVGARRGELDFRLSERELYMRLARQRGRGKAAVLIRGSTRNLVQSTSSDTERYPDVKWSDEGRPTEFERGTPVTALPVRKSIKEKVISSGTN